MATTSQAETKSDAELAALAKALGHPARVQLVRMLAARDSCYVGELADELPLAQSTISEHLRILREAGVVTSGTLAGRPCYCLSGDRLATLSDGISGLQGPDCC